MSIYGDNYYLTEGANIDMTKKFSEYRKEYSKQFKIMKKLYKSGDEDAYKKSVKKAKDIVYNMKKDINDIDASSASSQLFGFIAGTILNFSTYFIGIATPISVMNKVNKVEIISPSRYGLLTASMGTIISDILDTTKDKAVKDSERFNIYKTQLLRSCDDLLKHINDYDTIAKFRKKINLAPKKK